MENGKRDSMTHQGVLCNGSIPSIEPKSQSLSNQPEHTCVRGSCIPKLKNLEEIPFTPIIKLQTVTVSHLTRTVSWNSFISLLMLCKAVLY